MSEFRIDYTIKRRQPGEDDFTEVGFGSSGTWGDVDKAAHMLQSAIEHQEWETTPGMPDPADA